MADSASVFDLRGRKVPDLWGILSLFLLTILISDLQFTGFRLNQLGVIVTASLFVVSLIQAIGFLNIPFTEGHLLDGAFGFSIAAFLLGALPDLSNIEFSFLSQATESYLSGILPSNAGIVVDLVNKVFAPIGETFLIFGFAAGIRTIIEETRLSRLPFSVRFLIVSVPPSFIFATLHGGGRPISFWIFAFTINMVWTAIMYYGELSNLEILSPVPVGLGLIAGIHFGNNVAAGGGLFKFIGDLLLALNGDYGRSAAAVLLYLGVMFVLAGIRLLIILDESEVL